MDGVVIHLIIGGVLFTAFGFIYAMIEDNKEKNNDK